MTDYVITSRDPRVLEPVREFLRGNGIDPYVVPIHSTITVENGRVTTDRYIRGDDGTFVIVYGEPVIETVAVDLVVPWPADLVLRPLCVVEEDGAPCPYLAVYDTQRCVPHAEPPAPIPAQPYGDDVELARLGAQLDEADFAAAHDSVRPEIDDALQAALGEQLAGVVPVPVSEPMTLDDIVDAYRKLGAMAPKPFKLTPWQIDLIKASYASIITKPRRSLRARLWQVLTRRAR
jgi:hypothetical protein